LNASPGKPSRGLSKRRKLRRLPRVERTAEGVDSQYAIRTPSARDKRAIPFVRQLLMRSHRSPQAARGAAPFLLTAGLATASIGWRRCANDQQNKSNRAIQASRRRLVHSVLCRQRWDRRKAPTRFETAYSFSRRQRLCRGLPVRARIFFLFFLLWRNQGLRRPAPLIGNGLPVFDSSASSERR